MQTIADQIRNIRTSLGMTQVQLAERSGIAQSMIAEIENGRRTNLGLATIAKLAAGLNCQFLPQLIPTADIPRIREEQSTYVARKMVAISSGSAAIEMQPPSEALVNEQIAQLKKDLLEHKSALWRKI